MVSHCIRSKHYACSEFRRASVPYCRTATSEAVVYVAGPALGHGIFAITSVPSSFSMRSALLNPPSNFNFSDRGDSRAGRSCKFTKSLYVKLDVSAVALLLLASQKSTIRVLEKLVSTDRFACAGDQMPRCLACDHSYHDTIRRFSPMNAME